MTPELRAELARLARLPRLLVATDVDGTLAPIADQPELARILPDAARSLDDLARCSGVIVAIISGRSRQQLHVLLGGLADRILLVGSHGAEPPWDPDTQRRGIDLGAAMAVARQAALLVPGSWVEHKSVSVAWHVRGCPRESLEAAWPIVHARFAAVSGARVQPGLDVLECVPAHASKRATLRTLRARVRPDAALFLGDDEADADAMRELGPTDLGIAVGAARPGSRATVSSPEQAAGVLAKLYEARRAT